jgi:dGTPase
LTSAFDWRPWLSDKRIGISATNRGTTERTRSEFHKDYDRIIFSSAFRRLSDKTQVVPFPQSDYTRRRLTHSLEVSCVGRSLATEIFSFAELHLAEILPQGDFEAIVATACLAHDIGNPPFGHFGEKAIQDWARAFFRANGNAKAGTTSEPAQLADPEASFNLQLSDSEQADLLKFEGNAQSFRVLTRLQMANRNGGMQLTAATLGAMIKYPRPSIVQGSPRYRKHGCFQNDMPLFDEVFRTTGQQPSPAGEYFRHPLAWLSEAADDICYVIVDLEDGWKSGLITLTEATDILDAIGQPRRRDASIPAEDRLAMGRALAINQLVGQCAQVFRETLYRSWMVH